MMRPAHRTEIYWILRVSYFVRVLFLLTGRLRMRAISLAVHYECEGVYELQPIIPF